MDYSLLIVLLALLLVVLLFIRFKQSGTTHKKTTKVAKSSIHHNKSNQKDEDALTPDWMDQVNQSVSDPDQQDWEWGGSGSAGSTTSVSAQEVDPLTEYQVYKQFGYESKAAESLAGYLNGLNDGAPEKLVHELIGLNLRVGNIDMLAETLDRHGAVLTEDALVEYIKAGLMVEPNHLHLRVLAESKLGWNIQEVSRQIGEKTGLEENNASNPTLTIESNNQSVATNSSKRVPIVVHLGGNLQVTLTDTVGFIQDLPTELVSSFKSTLEESKHVDLLVHVIDASNPYHEEHEKTVLSIMKDLDMEDIPRLTLYNKADLVEDFTPTQTPYALISAKSEDSRDNLQALFLEKIKDIFESFTLRVPFSKSYKIHDLESVAILEERDYQEDGEVIRGYISEKNKWRLEEFYD